MIAVQSRPWVAQVPHVAIPNVFHTRIAPVTFRPAQNAAAKFVERSVAKVPGRARPPVIPKLRRYTAAQQRYIDRATTQWVRRAARDRGQRNSGDVSAQIGRYGTPREKRALNTYFRGGTTAAQNAALYRQAVMQTARTRGINAAIGGPSIDFGPPGVPGYRDPRALRRLRGALQSGNQGVQAVAGRAVRQALAPPTTDAGAAWLRAVNRVAAANRPGPVEKAGMFVFGPQHNPVAAATSGLYKNSAAFRDAVNLPANTVTSTYNLGAGVIEAVQGNPRRLKQIGSALRQHDPVVLAVRSLIEGNPKLLKRAGFEARTHPVSTLLELSGAGHGLARGGELAARVGGGLPRTLRQDVARVAARTGRRRLLPPALARDVPYRLPDTGIQGRRPFSRHALVRIAQRDRAARNIATSNRLRDAAARAKTAATHARQRGDAAAADALSRAATDGFTKANRIDPRIASPDEVRRWLNEHNSAMEDLRRGGRPQALRASAAATKGLDKKWVPILNLHLQGAVHLSRDDLKLYRTQLEHEAAHLTGSKLQANVATRGYLTKAIEAKHFPVDEIRAAAQRYRDHIKPVQRAVVDSGMLDPAAAERAPLFGYAVRRMGAVFDHGGRISGREQLLIPDSRGGFRHVSNDEIRAHMLDPNLGGGRVNPWDVIYLPQTPEARGAINYYRDWMQRETHRVPGQGRTGDAIRQGTLDIHPDVLGAHAANLRGLLDANHAFQDFYRQFGVRGAQGTYGKMRDLARQVKAETGRNLVPVRIKPWGGSEEQLGQLLEHASQAQFDEFGNAVSPIHDAVGRALNPSAHDPGSVRVGGSGGGRHDAGPHADPRPDSRQAGVAGREPGVPQDGVAVLDAVAVRQHGGGRCPDVVAGALQPGGYRVGLHADAPRAYGARPVVEADPSLSPVQRERAKAEVRARTVGGGHFEMQTRTMIHRTADWFMGDQSPKILRWAGRVAGTTARVPPVKLALQGLRWYTDGVLHTVNGTLERQFQTAMAGRAGRLTLIDRAMPTVSTRAAADLAQGLRGTAAQVELGRIVDRAYGKYSKFSPSLRAAVAQYTPFIAWTLNAARFLANVLPADHPVFTAVMAANVNAQNDWLLAHRMVPGQAGGVPDWLIGTFPGGGGHIPASRYTPFGLMQNFPANLSDLVLPQYSGFLKGLQGLDWKNQPVTGADTVEKRILLGFKQFADSNIPIYSQAQTILNRKEPGLGSKVLGFINPFTPYKNNSTSGSAAAGPHDAQIDKALQNLPAGGGPHDQAIDRALKSPAPGGLQKATRLARGTIRSPAFQAAEMTGLLQAAKRRQLKGHASPRTDPLSRADRTAFYTANIVADMARNVDILARHSQAPHRPPNPRLMRASVLNKSAGGGVPYVFASPIAGPDVQLRQGARALGVKALQAAAQIPVTKEQNTRQLRLAARQDPAFRRYVNRLYNRVRTTRALPKWARNAPNPRLAINSLKVVTNPKSPAYGQIVFGPAHGAAWANRAGGNRITFSRDTVNAVLGGGAYSRYYRQTPIHELAHIFQRPRMPQALTEGGAEAFRRIAAHDLGLPTTKVAPTYGRYLKRLFAHPQRPGSLAASAAWRAVPGELRKQLKGLRSG
jgi:hypothetical protein